MRGRSYLGFRLLDLDLPPEVARQVLALVAYHHDPKQLVRREMPERSYRRLARLVDLELLYHLEIADMRGRRCLDQAEQLEFIELYRLFAEEYGVFAPQGTMRSLYSDWFEHIHHEDSTNLRRDFRHLPLGLGFDYGAFTRLVVFNLPVAEVHRRNRERERSLPASVLDKQLDSVQWPALDEAHEVHFVGFESTPPGLISTA